MAEHSTLRPLQVFSVSDDNDVRILSLAFYENTLIVGTNVGTILGFSWYKYRLTKKSWEVYVASKNHSGPNDINTLHLQPDESLLHVGCGDNNLYAVDIEGGGKIVRTFKGHSDYIHSIASTASNKLYSASEDGFIRFWDTRTARCTNQLQPHKDGRLKRPQFGKWQGAVHATDNWLLCGGGPKPCLYHLRSLECSQVFDFNSSVHVMGFLDETVYIGGDNNHLFQFNLRGDLTAQIPVSATSIYSVVTQAVPEKFISIAGASNCLDICTNHSYKDISVQLYEPPQRR